MEAIIGPTRLIDTHEVKRVHDLTAFLRRILPQYATICSPVISELIKEDEPHVWTEKREKAFENLKNKPTQKTDLGRVRDDYKQAGDCRRLRITQPINAGMQDQRNHW
ncbi:Hypothetical protein CINCED_3A025770 [Cinara cedri]|uniref:Uncharacterized protein n=1 Tax=Cinara cedri TaxID=506608 RepID=A0A5E4N0Q0_9HEMI|nr:Hypothetical protein CINCED_3A025770 [Cinara cedri]